jgi:hypothetical protein
MEQKTIRDYIGEIVNSMVKASISDRTYPPSWWLVKSLELSPLIQKASERMVKLNQEIAQLKVEILDKAKENKEKISMTEIDVRMEATDIQAEANYLKGLINWSYEEINLAKKMASINIEEIKNQY